MKYLLFLAAFALLLASCKKENGGNNSVEVYLLKSFDTELDASTSPGITRIKNPVLENVPLLENGDIIGYRPSSFTLYLNKNIKTAIEGFGPDKGFAVTVNRKPVYYGRFHPAYLSSITFGLATIDPILSSGNEMTIQFVKLEGSVELNELDKRNDSRITEAFSASNRLRFP